MKTIKKQDPSIENKVEVVKPQTAPNQPIKLPKTFQAPPKMMPRNVPNQRPRLAQRAARGQ